MVQRVKLKFTCESKRIFTGQQVFYCLLNSSHKLMLTKIFRAVFEFLMSTVFTSMRSFPCGLTFRSQLKWFEKQSWKIPSCIYIDMCQASTIYYYAL